MSNRSPLILSLMRTPCLLSKFFLKLLYEEDYTMQKVLPPSYAKYLDIQLDENALFAFVKMDYLCFKQLLWGVLDYLLENAQFSNVNSYRFAVTLKALDNQLLAMTLTYQDIGTSFAGDYYNELLQRLEVFVEHFGGSFATEEKNNHKLIVMQFPMIQTPNWCVNELTLSPGQQIVLLSNNKILASLAKSRFKEYHSTHFYNFDDSAIFLHDINRLNHDNFLFLVDYCLPGCYKDSIKFINDCGLLEKAVIISHQDDQAALRRRVMDAGIKLLPTYLLRNVPIRMQVGADDYPT